MNSILHRAFLSHVEDEEGYPNMAFEHFYQYGLDCFFWRLPRPMIRRAFQRACHTWKSESGIAMWQVRAFIDGLRGQRAVGTPSATPLVPETYSWPLPADASWTLVACVYPDGFIDLDIVHEVSRRFWSEDNGFLELPPDDAGRLTRCWFERTGVDVLVMQPDMAVDFALPKRHLHVV